MTQESKCNDIIISFGSQTGNAEHIAHHIMHLLKDAEYNVSSCSEMNDFPKRFDLKKNDTTPPLFIFITSTTGDGDPPDNATQFWRWFRKAGEETLNLLKDIKYALLGLGDTNYSNFNEPAKKLDRKLKSLGLIPIVNKALADDATGLDAIVDPWIENLIKVISEHVNKTVDLSEKENLVGATSTVHGHQEKNIINPSSAEGEIEKGTMKQINMNDEKIAPDIQQQSQENSLSNSVEGLTTAVEILNIENKQKAQTQSSHHVVDVKDELVEKLAQLTGLPKSHKPFLEIEINEATEQNQRQQKNLRSSNVDYPLFAKFSKLSGDPFAYNHDNAAQASITSATCLSGVKALERVIEIEIDTKPLNCWQYTPGDAIAIICPNTDDLCLNLLKRLNIQNPNTFISIKSLDGNASSLPAYLSHIDTPITYHQLVKWFIDWTSFPKKGLFRVFGEHAKDPLERKKLLFLSSTLGNPTYRALRDERPTILDILISFPSCEIPLSRLIEQLPRLQPRYYSIASSPSLHPQSLLIALNVVNYNTSQGIVKEGLCSTWLDNLTGKVNQRDVTVKLQNMPNIPMYPKPVNDMNFRMPQDEITPVIMIANGTGVTPFYGWIEHLCAPFGNIRKTLNNNNALSEITNFNRKIWLIYGTRFLVDDGDLLYKPNFERALSFGVLSKFDLAISRGSGPRCYVQDKVKEQTNMFKDWVLNKKASIFVCGSLAMSKDLHQCMSQLLTSDETDGMKLLTEMMTSKKYVREIWG